MDIKELVVLFLVGMIFCMIPVVGTYFRCLNTMYHEDGHALMSLLTFGKIKKIDIFYNTEGLITHTSKNRFLRFLVTLAGYPFASAMAWVLAYLYLQEDYEKLCYLIAGTGVINLIFWVRNLYGIIWLITFGTMTVLTYFYVPQLNILLIKLIVAVTMYASVKSAFDVLSLSIKKPKDAGDATTLRKSTMIPTFIWGSLFFAQSILALYLITKI